MASHTVPAVTRPPARRGFWRAALVSWWFWGTTLVAFVASPALALSTLVLGAVLAAAGVVAWARRRLAWICAAGMGLILGSLPYIALAVLQVTGVR
ncbi:hypothetical protein [Krasilnikoviella flava]|uniref:Uncharacterized protein n=1 Tax=Krasilnikoviella flava TaxID=526729 RepID=A0A1T5KGI8_9MICO|nr:hypothetical protein [Krasilnikoviella flava]SKC62793.1 hypothetical protein SAMN04324258_2182 [Krasilnikoviella flava]